MYFSFEDLKVQRFVILITVGLRGGRIWKIGRMILKCGEEKGKK
jgi:hypothetical protein